MADNSPEEERDDNGPQSIFDLFEPPPEPDPNTFGKVPVVRGEDDDFDRKNGTTAAERKAAAEAEAAGLQHWTEPATGQVPAVFGSDDERGGWTSGRGPSWQGDENTWTGPDLSDVFADHEPGGDLPTDSRTPSSTVGRSRPDDFDPQEGREIPRSTAPTVEPEQTAAAPRRATGEWGGLDADSAPAGERRPASEGPGPGADVTHDALRRSRSPESSTEQTRPHSRFDSSPPSREWDLGASSEPSQSPPSPAGPRRAVADRAIPGDTSSTPGGRPGRSDFDLDSAPSRPTPPPQFERAPHPPPSSSPLDRPSSRFGDEGPVPGDGSRSVPGVRPRAEQPGVGLERHPADPGRIRFEGIEEPDAGTRGLASDGSPSSLAGPAGQPSPPAGAGAFDRHPVDDEAATAPGMYGFDDAPYRPDYDGPASPPVAQEAPAGGRNVPQAIAVGVALAGVALVAMWLGPAFTMVVVVAAALLAVVELFNSMRLAGLRPAALLGILGTVAAPVAAYYRGDAAYTVIVALGVVFGVLWYLAGADTERPVLNLSLTLFGVLWIGGLGSFAALILRSDVGVQLLLSTILITIVSDLLAYVGGRAYGSRPFHRSSPSKTWEGTMTGFVGAVFTGFALGVVPFETMWDSAFTEALLLGAVVGLLAPIGDLAESMVKRDLGVKDMGTILPGHGGVLDRIDALLFALPGAYYLALTTGLL
jgi:CDP-diglyceride synthetase